MRSWKEKKWADVRSPFQETGLEILDNLKTLLLPIAEQNSPD